MQCEFLEEYSIRNTDGIQIIPAGSVYFIHPDKAVHLLVAGRVRPVDYGAINSLPYMDENGYLSKLQPGISQAEWNEDQESDEMIKEVLRMREDSDRYMQNLHDLAASGSGLTPEQIAQEGYKLFSKMFTQYFIDKSKVHLDSQAGH